MEELELRPLSPEEWVRAHARWDEELEDALARRDSEEITLRYLREKQQRGMRLPRHAPWYRALLQELWEGEPLENPS